MSSISFEYGEVAFKMISLSIPNASLKQKLSLQCNVDDDICIE
jgi:hypothetical protein